MARPKQYDGKRADTKVRLRPDHADLLRQAVEERGLSRNRLIEMALDAFFDIRSTSPRLQKSPKEVTPIPKTTTRRSPRLR